MIHGCVGSFRNNVLLVGILEPSSPSSRKSRSTHPLPLPLVREDPPPSDHSCRGHRRLHLHLAQSLPPQNKRGRTVEVDLFACLRLRSDGGDIPLSPASFRKVRKLNRGTTFADRLAAQRLNSRPRSSIIYIHIGRQTFAHTLEQTVDHDEVHTAVPAKFMSEFTLPLP